jgi:hypothetical protein
MLALAWSDVSRVALVPTVTTVDGTLDREMSSESVVPARLPIFELPVEELLHRARPLPPHDEMLIEDLDEAEGLAFLAALNG